MKVKELIDKLANYDSDMEVYLYEWDTKELKCKSTSLTEVQVSRMGWEGIYLLGSNWPECMVGGHGDGCMCNLGFIPRWRNING